MIKACVIGLSTIGLLHCENLIRIKKTKLSYVFDYNHKLRNKISKKFKCKTFFEKINNFKLNDKRFQEWNSILK